MLKKIASLVPSVLGIALAFAALPAAGGEIVTCVYLKGQEEHRCIIKTNPNDAVRTGDDVVAYEKDIYWAGTGKIIKVKGIYSVASFKNAGNGLSKGLRAEIQARRDLEAIDWSTAFSKRN